VNVGCIVDYYTPPVVPTLLEATYTIFDPLKTITLAPAFVEYPPCPITPNIDFAWTIPDNVGIFRATDGYSLNVVSVTGL